MVNDALNQLGWYTASSWHEPINFIPKPFDRVEIKDNTLTLASEGLEDTFAELGSLLSDHTHTYFLDFFAENDTVGMQMAGDLRDIIEGRVSAIGRTGPILHVIDYTAATPSEIFFCDIERVKIDRGRMSSEIWKNTWWAVSFEVVDHYADDNG